MAIKLCFMSPIAHLGEFSERGDMLLALPHIVQNSTIYEKYYRDTQKKIILDSGVIEVGKPEKFEILIKIGENIEASVIALPDYLHDASKTIESAKIIYENFHNYIRLKRFSFMGIIQGKNVKEWLKCFEKMANMDMITILGIGIYSVKHVFQSITHKTDCLNNRLACIELLDKKNMIPKGKKIHLLGLGEPRELLYQKDYPFINSCDTTRPIMYGINGRRYTKEGYIIGGEYEGSKMDYFMKIPKCNYSDIMFNIDVVKRLAQ